MTEIPKPPPGTDNKACAVCSQLIAPMITVLNARIVDGEIVGGERSLSYVHLNQPLAHPEHPAVPVEVGELKHPTAMCDFCGAFQYLTPEGWEGWTVVASDFMMPNLTANTEMTSGGDWSACDDCVAFIKRGHWSGLLKHALDTYAARRKPGQEMNKLERLELRGDLHETYRRLAAHMTGEIVLTREHQTRA